MDNWKARRDDNIVSPQDWYGNVKQKRNNKPQSAIQQSVSQKATDAQCGNKAPQPGAHRVQAARATFLDSWIRSKASKMLSCRIFFFSVQRPWLSPGRLPHCMTLHEQ